MKKKLMPHRAVEQLQTLIDLGAYDVESEHKEAEEILLAVLRWLDQHEVADKYEEAKEKIGFWYA